MEPVRPAKTLISFSAYGSYSITLIATNSYGSDTMVQTNYITVSPLPELPIVETWTFASNSAFTVINPDGGMTWAVAEVAGPTVPNLRRCTWAITTTAAQALWII